VNIVLPDDPIAVAFRSKGPDAALRIVLDAEKAAGVPRPAKVPRGPNPLEEAFAALWAERGNGLAPEREFKFALAVGRKFRLDFAWPGRLLAVEMEGVKDHASIKGLRRDTVKGNLAVRLGWRVLRYTGRCLKDRPAEVVVEVVELLEAAR
jgi:very-short-patch-repair endonuclease